MLALQNLLMATKHRRAITFGTGATHFNVQTTTNTAMTLNVNVGDCVVIFSVNSPSGQGVTDNGAGGGNTYTHADYCDIAGDGLSCYVCLSATVSATAVSSAHTYIQLGMTLLNVQSVGATTQSGYMAINNPSIATPSLTTEGTNSLVVGAVMSVNNNLVYSANIGTIVEQGVNGGFAGAMLTFQARPTGNVVALEVGASPTSPGGGWVQVELIPKNT
jgi:hypothetical protein